MLFYQISSLNWKEKNVEIKRSYKNDSSQTAPILSRLHTLTEPHPDILLPFELYGRPKQYAQSFFNIFFNAHVM